MADQGKPQGTLTTSQLKTIKVVAIDSTALDPKKIKKFYVEPFVTVTTIPIRKKTK